MWVQKDQSVLYIKKNIVAAAVVVDKDTGAIATRDHIHPAQAKLTSNEQEKSIFIGCTCAKRNMRRKYLPPFLREYAHVA